LGQEKAVFPGKDGLFEDWGVGDYLRVLINDRAMSLPLPECMIVFGKGHSLDRVAASSTHRRCETL
jgi:hypothetical protein